MDIYIVLQLVTVVSVCITPCIGPIANAAVAETVRIVRERIYPPKPAANISSDSQLVCTFRPSSE